ncbi:MAG: S8 family serine peptidase, partial [Holophagales bacterium]|nr:S8 family serine peptidase [Holophagales bacterium]
MKLSLIKYCFTILALVLLALGLGCNSSDPRDADGDTGLPPVKDIPTVSNPTVQYNFYEPKTEDGLRLDTNYGYLIAKTKPGFKKAALERMGFQVVGSMTANGAIYYRLYKNGDVLSALNTAKKHAGIVFIEPEFNHYIEAVETNPITFNNPDFYMADNSLYGVYTTKAYNAWLKYGFGPNKPVVASVDTGVRWRHEDLLAQMKHAFSWYTPGANPANWVNHVSLEDGSIPLDGPRLLDLVPDFMLPYNGKTYYSTDQNMHGTHTAGTMVATGNNGVGIAGICWNSELINYRCFPTAGGASSWSIYGSLWHLARWKEVNNYTATIPINYSLSGATASQFALDMLSHGLQHGIIVVAATGNIGQGVAAYPAAYSGVIAVGATDGADKLTNFSCWGPHVSVVAPGHNIASTIIASGLTTAEDGNDWYGLQNGTSMAAPHVTGLVGYMLTFNPDLKPDQIKTYIEQNADFIDGRTGFSEEYGWGRINVLKTIEAVVNDVNSGRTPPSTYAINPVKVKAPADGLSVWLYNCNSDGTVQNYVASSVTGSYRTSMENNVAYFNLLRPGLYIAKAYIGGANVVGSTTPFEVRADMAPLEVSLNVDGNLMAIQTFPTQDILYSNGNNICDTLIILYNSNGNPLAYFDFEYWDTLLTFIPPNGDYYAQIASFDGDQALGEYALYVTANAAELWTPENPED